MYWINIEYNYYGYSNITKKQNKRASHAWTTDMTEIVTTITIRTSTFGAIRRR